MRSRHRLGLVLLAAVLGALIVVPAAVAQGKRAKAPTLKVMTRNLYLGGDIFLPFRARTREDFEQNTQELWDQVGFTNFPARAKLLAKEIEAQAPDLVGLQEVALWRRSALGVKDGFQTPSTILVYDFLKSLRRALNALGLRYRVAVVQQEADLEAPTRQHDVRLTMRDAILVRRERNGVKVLRERSERFRAKLALPTPGGRFTSHRGWTYVDASLAGRRFRFLNTHLEAFADEPRAKQSQELVARGGPARSRKAMILVGDLNSQPKDGDGADRAAYGTLIGSGFGDAWTQARGSDLGFTCCLARTLINGPPPFSSERRIDYILVKPPIRALKAQIWGSDPANRTSTGLWPSDHGGVSATLRLGR